ncbi:LacI family DNA-binding transcriptional regulator [Micromonospora sp. CPCC 205556]|uniref:LacI family DNA-binding transcriptional regulator n=1 Tax=Micromonospora sp. CPCC 205556 TaxID=3122398 RepID=UPI002FEED032
MANRSDVARLAGTSPSVVSYVLNDGPRGVAPATRERVLAAIAELGYRPNAVARSLRMSRTMTFGLVIPDNSNPFFAELARCIEEVGFEYGYTMLLGNAMDDDEREAAYVRALLDRQVDGLILVPAHGARTWIAELSQTPVPRLVLDRQIAIPHATQVLVDNEAGAYEATAHLLSHGHRRIGCLAGPADLYPTVDRVAGWRRALSEARLDPDASPLVHVPFGRAHGYRAGRQLLGGAQPPDALFVASDEQAVGVLRAAAELGVRVPADLALCSFDGIEASAYTVPALTTMRQPFEELGRAAVEWLVSRVETPATPATRIVLAARLVARGSCGCVDPAGGDHAIDGDQP